MLPNRHCQQINRERERKNRTMNVRFISIECCHDATLYALCVSIQTINTLCVAISLNTGVFEWKIAKISWLLSLWSFMITYCVHSLFYLIFKKTHVSQAIAIYLADFFSARGVCVHIFRLCACVYVHIFKLIQLIECVHCAQYARLHFHKTNGKTSLLHLGLNCILDSMPNTVCNTSISRF